MNALQELEHIGQSVWIDVIRRQMITSGELQRLAEEDGVSGVTSNPSIFEKALSAGTDYDEQICELLQHDPNISTRDLFEKVMVQDIQMATDVLRPVYDRTDGADGFVSLEVTPPVAHDTQATIAEVRKFWKAVGRPNLMIKIPATREGMPAVEQCLSEGMNINITLMFSLAHYEAVAEAFLRGVARAPEPARVASVASFFVSRVDTKVDKRLEAIGKPEALALRGKSAVANAKLAYRRYQEIFEGEPFAVLRNRGVRPQRCLWASTSTKNPAYPDTLYVDTLVGPSTVNTMPIDTLKAVKDHGHDGVTVTEGVEEAEAQVKQLTDLGISLYDVGDELLTEGLQLFGDSFDKLLAALDKKREQFLAGEDTS